MQNGTILLNELSPELRKEFTQLIEQGVENQIKKHLGEKSDPEQLLTREETAFLLKCDIGTLWRWAKQGKLIPVGIGNRVFYKKSSIMEALQPLNG